MVRNFEEYPVTLGEMIKLMREYQAQLTALKQVGDPRPHIVAKIVERLKMNG